ncbi:glycosyltransferase [Microbacterium sp. NPDC089987]|uniref:glycosyltransferase n=1 Tax=Microbacterium sp. NPDC089987 TaxID=3364202 RepID=UPI0037FEEFE6
MNPNQVQGLPAMFDIDGLDMEQLSERERRLLVGALNFHALMAPERELDIHLYDGDEQSHPRTTDDTTFSGLSRENRNRLRTLRMRSLVPREERNTLAIERESEELIAQPSRHLHISADAVLGHDPVRGVRTDLVGRIARRVKAAAPLMYDEARDLALLRHSRALNRMVPRQDYEGHLLEEVGIDGPVPAPHAPDGAVPAVIIGMHWFELGGAERWAFETVRIVREAGFLPIVLTNRASHQPWITRPELDGAMLIPFSEATSRSQTLGVEPLLRAILRTFDVRGVVVHHNQWLYDRLAWIAHSRPGLPIVDSTHIVEYRGGGYPLSSALVSNSIGKHHVISPSLARWMTDVQQIAPEKIVMAPLGGLTVSLTDAQFRPRRPDERFTVTFIGRMARQKAPEVFVDMARRLHSRGIQLRFVMHGDGELASWVDDVARSMGMADRIERRSSTHPVPETLDESHLLVVSSHNEGLTLTTLEAIAHGVPVVSTDVGAQSDIVPASALAPRDVHRASRALAAKVAELAVDERAREALWRTERKAEKRLLGSKNATEWFVEEVSGW